jgi:hypothetical protein
MRQSYIICAVISLLIGQQSFAGAISAANEATAAVASSENELLEKPCESIAQACLKAGYMRVSGHSKKSLWMDCMKPVLLGKAVNGVSMDQPTVIACRQAKIVKMQKELKQFEQVSST